MKHYSHYDPSTGEFTGVSVFGDEEAIALNVTAENPAIEGHHDRETHRVNLKTGQVVPREAPRASSATERHHAALARIHALEARQARAVIEHVLGDASAKQRVRDLEDEIARLRQELQ
jgi:hypothetical protein